MCRWLPNHAYRFFQNMPRSLNRTRLSCPKYPDSWLCIQKGLTSSNSTCRSKFSKCTTWYVHGIQSSFRRLHLIIQPRCELHTRLINQLRDHLRHPQCKWQQDNMRHQKARLQPQGAGFWQRESINQERSIDLMFRSIPSRRNVDSIAKDP